MKSVKRKKDEFERDMSPCDLLRYPRCVLSSLICHVSPDHDIVRPLLQLQPDSWLLSRLSPHTNPQPTSRPPPQHMEAETDSGLDSLTEESDKLKQPEEDREKLIGEDEMQVDIFSLKTERMQCLQSFFQPSKISKLTLSGSFLIMNNIDSCPSNNHKRVLDV